MLMKKRVVDVENLDEALLVSVEQAREGVDRQRILDIPARPGEPGRVVWCTSEQWCWYWSGCEFDESSEVGHRTLVVRLLVRVRGNAYPFEWGQLFIFFSFIRLSLHFPSS
jgi:hypothetical protein